MPRKLPTLCHCLPLILAMPGLARAIVPASELADMSLEQLSNITVMSVSRQDERLSDVAASIFIIGAGDIRQSGARTLPEVLRLAPNLQVARIDARNYAVTARGFSSAFENKLLVLIDGRSVYTPLFSGVFWDAQAVVLEDIERIEVISGAGATIWGANAVNGVINIITRAARDTQGGRASLAAGEHERDTSLRYGAAFANGGHYRVYAKYDGEDDTETATGLATRTGWHRRQAGFRSDWDGAAGGLTVSGDAYQGKLAQPFTRDILIAGANLASALAGKTSDSADYRIQLVLDHTERNQPNAFVERLDTIGLEAQHNLHIGARQRLAWGAGYRYSADHVVANFPGFAFLPARLGMHWGNIFAQDEIALSDSLRLTAGLKFEHNNYTGVESLPTLRLAWTVAPSALLWASASRTVRAPSRIDRDLYAPAAPLLINGQPRFIIGGGPDFMSETADVAELGFRAQPVRAFSYSVTAFHSSYDKLRTLEPVAGAASVFRNLGEGSTRGVELWGTWQPSQGSRFSGGLVLQDIRTALKDGSKDSSGTTGLATNDPRRHWLLRWAQELSETIQADMMLRYNGKLPNPAVPAYYEMDLQVVWRPRHDIDIALVGQNLLHASHVEFGPVTGRSVFERAALLKLAKRF